LFGIVLFCSLLPRACAQDTAAARRNCALTSDLALPLIRLSSHVRLGQLAQATLHSSFRHPNPAPLLAVSHPAPYATAVKTTLESIANGRHHHLVASGDTVTKEPLSWHCELRTPKATCVTTPLGLARLVLRRRKSYIDTEAATTSDAQPQCRVKQTIAILRAEGMASS
jgi:hypothetical protein